MDRGQPLAAIVPQRARVARLRRLALLFLCATPLACHWLRAPDRPAPELSEGIHERSLSVQERSRSYSLYVPEKRPPLAPLVVLMHGSRQTAEGLRRATGYGFDRLADEHGFIVVYPSGYERRWNDCRAGGRYAARRLQIDDVGFVLALVDELVRTAGADPTRVFLAGYSAGGQLAFRIALQHPERIAGIAVFGANLPTPENWACPTPSGRGVPVLLVNGTRDRINPFEGGKVTVFGFASRGMVRSSLESAQFFAERAGVPMVEHSRMHEGGDTWIEHWRWYAGGRPEVRLLAVHGGGHVVPGSGTAFPRILGRVSDDIDGPRESWQFFARQAPSSASAQVDRDHP
jgi:polyhydroxybutyrate depolymerase